MSAFYVVAASRWSSELYSTAGVREYGFGAQGHESTMIVCSPPGVAPQRDVAPGGSVMPVKISKSPEGELIVKVQRPDGTYEQAEVEVVPDEDVL